MRSRSSRLFIVLLHLVGVSTNLPRNLSYYNWNVGIVGVHPVAILSESLELDAIGGLDGLLTRLPPDYQEGILSQPYWLQDDLDGRCLGPEGFSECGDTALWIIRRKHMPTPVSKEEEGETSKTKKKGLGKLFSFLVPGPGHIYESHNEERDWGYAIQLIDTDMMPLNSQTVSIQNDLMSREEQEQQSPPPRTKHQRRNKKNEKQEGDCLMVGKTRRRRIAKEKRSNEPLKQEHPLTLGSCTSDKAWNWRIDGKGILTQEIGSKVADLRSNQNSLCVWRVNSTAVLTPFCDFNLTDSSAHDRDEYIDTSDKRVVEFSMVRYQAAPPNVIPVEELPVSSAIVTDIAEITDIVEKEEIVEDKESISDQKQESLDTSSSHPAKSIATSAAPHVPHTKSTSEMHANDPVPHPELKPMSSLLTTSLPLGKTASILKDSQPTLLVTGDAEKTTKSKSPTMQKNALRPPNQKRVLQTKSKGLDSDRIPKKQILHPTSPSLKHETVAYPRKIPVHPYIAASKNGVWEDPQTGLEFLTDICGYLGHDRKESGRHTLMGVGQYMRTVFNIKVYGVALYVSKRDVLADSTFKQYASLNADQLRARGDFYDRLMNMPSNGRGIDRTLLLKLNMQLGTDTMRQSLEADWKMLTDEHKEMLISSSFKSRPVDEKMLEKIQSKDNPSRCSCAQVAPEEYEGDPTCCARGTELGFTWRKNGDMEVRLDGRLMDAFPDPGLASGIFYEYLRGDDPISVDAREHFADGFPFLLAPLAQVRGVSVGHTPDIEKVHESSYPSSSQDLFGSVSAEDFAGMVGDQAAGFLSWAHSYVVDGTISNIKRTSKAVGDSGKYLNKKRQDVGQQMSSISSNSLDFVSRRIPFMSGQWQKQTSVDSLVVELNGQEWDGIQKIMPNRSSSTRYCDRTQSEQNQNCEPLPWGRVLYPRGSGDQREVPYSFGGGLPLSDEIGVIIHPTMNFTHKLYLYMVHLYLMLLLIVSLPESHNTRSRLVMRRRGGRYKESSDEYTGVTKSICSGRMDKLEVSLQVSLGKNSRQQQQGYVKKQPVTFAEELASTKKKRDEVFATKDNQDDEYTTSNMKKSLSYYL